MLTNIDFKLISILKLLIYILKLFCKIISIIMNIILHIIVDIKILVILIINISKKIIIFISIFLYPKTFSIPISCCLFLILLILFKDTLIIDRENKTVQFNEVTGCNSKVSINLGAFSKGYIADKVTSILKQEEATWLLDAGMSTVACFASLAFLILVSISAITSDICIIIILLICK